MKVDQVIYSIQGNGSETRVHIELQLSDGRLYRADHGSDHPNHNVAVEVASVTAIYKLLRMLELPA